MTEGVKILMLMSWAGAGMHCVRSRCASGHSGWTWIGWTDAAGRERMLFFVLKTGKGWRRTLIDIGANQCGCRLYPC